MPNDRLSKIQNLLQSKTTSHVRSRPQFWKPQRLLERITPSAQIQSWLKTPDSLTTRIRQICPEMTVKVLSERLERPLLDESNVLGLHANDQAWVRCVLLQCPNPADPHKHSNWVYARTVIPNLNAESPWAALQKLGNQPLGEVLFDLPSIQRTPFEFSSQKLTCWPYLNEQINPEHQQLKGYARRSIFTQEKAPLLLTEVFLPGLVSW